MNASLLPLLEGLACQVQGPLQDVALKGVATTSTAVRPGFLFAALPGLRSDGHTFVPDALARGATAVLVSRPLEVPSEITRILVDDTRLALARIAPRMLGDDSRNLTLIGITGTNGKTTCTYLLEAVLQAAGLSTGVIGTVAYRGPGFELPAPNTTPDLLTFHQLLHRMAGAGTAAVVAEVSSHGLDQRRVEGAHFDGALFTNLTRDHLDYHPDMDHYFSAKARLFGEVLKSSAKPRTVAAINLDDPYGLSMLQHSQASRTWGFSRMGHPDAQVRTVYSHLDLQGISARIETPASTLHVQSPLLGNHNLENVLGVVTLAVGLDLPLEAVARGIASCRAVPGRLEAIDNNLGVTILVDYAHSDDALRNVLKVLRPLTAGSILTVFGCGGDRDAGKRPLMGGVAREFSELSIITSDNPRSEDPDAIIASILEGVDLPVGRSPNTPVVAGERSCLILPDRKEAIFQAVQMARLGHVVLIAGKGHETTQILGSRTTHFDDREVARAALKQREAA